MSACDKEQLLLLASDDLGPRQAAQAERHVAEGPACAAELERLRQGLAALDRLCADIARLLWDVRWNARYQQLFPADGGGLPRWVYALLRLLAKPLSHVRGRATRARP